MLAGKAQVSWLRLRNLAPSTEEKPGAGDAASRRGRAAPWSVLPAPPSRPFPAASQHLGLLRAGIPSMESLSPLRAPAAPLCPRELGIRSGNEAQAEVRGFLKAAVVNSGFPSRENPSTLRALAEFCPFLAVFKAEAPGAVSPWNFRCAPRCLAWMGREGVPSPGGVVKFI